jgi:hypothetical protein
MSLKHLLFEPLRLVKTNIFPGRVAETAKLVLIFNNPLSPNALSKIHLTGVSQLTNTLDPSGKILTIDPGRLGRNSQYTIELDHITDIYSQTLHKMITFTTAG